MNGRHMIEALKERALDVIALDTRGEDRDAFLDELNRFQREHLPTLAKLGARFPALPVDVLRHVRVALHDEAEDVRVFRTSGTSSGERGAHPFRDLTLYDQAAELAARHALFPDLAPGATMRLCVLAPHERERPDSSLSYMLSRFVQWFGDEHVFVFQDDALQLDQLQVFLMRATEDRAPVALLGTSFAFVHADDGLEHTFSLPPGSRIMQTGGFKGRSREIAKPEMLTMLASRYGIAKSHIIAEYGMTELSSQMYETTLRDALLGNPIGPRRLWIPPWVRATPVDPESLRAFEGEDVGVLRIDDAANVDTTSALLTSDLARRVEDGIEILGRASGATARGCSLAADAVLSR